MPWGMTSYSNTGLPRPTQSYTYDANGNRTSQTNELGKVTTWAYDNLNRLTSRTDPDPDGSDPMTSPVTSYTYDVFGNRLSLTDPVSNVTSWTYDLLDRQLEEENQNNDERFFTYNVRGDLLTRTDRNGRLIAYSYDLLGRLKDEAWDDSPATHYAFTYDKKGQMLSADGYKAGSPNSYFSEYDYAYNNVGWRSSEVLTQGTALKSTLATTYDVGGRRATLKNSFSTNSGFTTTTSDFQNDFGYDAANRLTSLKQSSQSGGNVVANKYVLFGYDANSNITSIDRYANTTNSNLVAHTDLEYDYLNRVEVIDHQKSGTISKFSLTYDARSRITAIDDVFSNSSWNETHAYTYDNTDQLTVANHSAQNDESYAYDKNGNRTGNQTHLGTTLTSTVGTNNRVSSVGTSGTAGSFTLAYDDEGNLITKTDVSSGSPGATEAYTYDHRNRLTKVSFKSTPSGSSTLDVYYYYDHNNLLIRREVDSDGDTSGGITSREYFVYDGMQIVARYTAGASGDASLANRYLWGPLVDQLISDEQVTSLSSAGTVYWALSDQLGTAHDFVTYASGTDTTTVAKHRSYDAYGNLTQDTATGVVILFGFTARYTDPTTKLQYNTNRWYATLLGVWMSEDPIGFSAGDENLRRYVGNKQVNATDPTGLVLYWGYSTQFLQSFFMAWYSAERLNMAWVATIPIPPATLQFQTITKSAGGGIGACGVSTVVTLKVPITPNGWEEDNSAAMAIYHPNAWYGYRRKGTGDAGAQAMYDRDGKLITDGLSAGTADKSTSNHYYVDVVPFDIASDLDWRLGGTFYRDLYRVVRPPNTGTAPANVVN
jgi:RHS repeat-associated protein